MAKIVPLDDLPDDATRDFSGKNVEQSQLKHGDTLDGQMWDANKQAFVPHPKNAVPTDDLPQEFANAMADTVHAGMEHLPGSNVIPDKFGKELAAYRRGPAAYQRYQDALNIPEVGIQDGLAAIPLIGPALGAGSKQLFNLPDSRLGITAGQELDKLRTGINKFGYTLAGMSGINSDEATFKKLDQLDKDRADKDELMREYNDTGSFADNIYGSLPYFVDGALVGPKLAKGAESIVSKLSSGPEALATEGKGAITKVVEYLANMNTPESRPLQLFGQRAKAELTDKWAANAIGKSRQVEGMTPLSRGAGSLLGSGALGAVESALHPEQTASGGAVSSMAGTLTGRAMAPFLTRALNYRDKFPNEKELLDWYKLQGGVPTPGLELGDQSHQMFEAGMENSGSFSNAIKQQMDANRIIDNRTAWEALGVPRGQVDTMGHRELQAHLDKLGKEYDAIERSTVGQFSPLDRQKLLAHLGELKKDGTVEGKNIYNDAMDYKLRIDKLMAPNRNALGQQIPSTITGSDFKELRSRLKSDISGYYDNSKKNNAEALKPFVGVLDDAVERAMGPEQLAKWKDLNLRTALTNDVMSNGLNELGRFDPSKYGSHAMSTDAKRFLTESGSPELNQLYRLAKVDFMKTNQAGSSLSGMGVKGFGDKTSILSKLLSNTPPTLRWPVDLGLRMYMSGYPVRTGLLNMSGKDLGNPALYTRAYQANVQSWPNLYNDVTGIPKTLQEMMKDKEDEKSR